ncbi:MAG: hypothetical protein QW057_04150 [Candidatus Bathyarchaeia archaeon]
MQSRGFECLSWIREAEEALRRADYETAAAHLRRVVVYLRAAQELDLYPRYVRKLCDSYLAAADARRTKGDVVQAAFYYRAAASCLWDLGDEPGAAKCKQLVTEYYDSLLRSGFAGVKATPKDLKGIGDYLKASARMLDGAECYLRAARAASEDGKTLLAAGLFRDAADAHREAGETRLAVRDYERAAEHYARAGLDFEAAWHLIIASFLQTSLGEKPKAEALAQRALQVSVRSRIPVLINELAYTAIFLAQGNVVEAREQWGYVRRKLTPSYVSVVEKSFNEAARTMSNS